MFKSSLDILQVANIRIDFSKVFMSIFLRMASYNYQKDTQGYETKNNPWGNGLVCEFHAIYFWHEISYKKA